MFWHVRPEFAQRSDKSNDYVTVVRTPTSPCVQSNEICFPINGAKWRTTMGGQNDSADQCWLFAESTVSKNKSLYCTRRFISSSFRWITRHGLLSEHTNCISKKKPLHDTPRVGAFRRENATGRLSIEEQSIRNINLRLTGCLENVLLSPNGSPHFSRKFIPREH